MIFNRRCGASLVVSVVLILFFLLVPQHSLAQAVTVVSTGTRAAGTGSAGYSSDYGTAATVSLNAPSYIAFDSNGNQYLSDTLNNCVRKIDTAGNMTTVAGLAVSGQSDTCNSSSNAAPTAAQGLSHPTGLAVDSANRLYIADSLHHCVRVLNSGSTGVAALTTAAGTCGTTDTASVTPMPNGLAIDSANNLYIALQDSAATNPVNQVVRHALTDAASTVCLMAGAASANVSASCSGVNNTSVLSGPSGLAVDATNNLYIADTGNNCIRELAAMTTQQTVVGQCSNDGTGSVATTLRNPYGLAVSPTQALLISESNPDNVVSYANGSLTLMAGLPSGIAGAYLSNEDGTSALNASLNSPRGIAFDSLAHLFVADSLNNITRELSNKMQFANTPVGSQSATQPITFVINQPVNLTVAAGSDFTISSTTCSGSLTPAAAGAAPNTCQVFGSFAPTRPGLRHAALKLTDSVSGTSVFQGLQGTGTGALSLFTPGAMITAAANLSAPAAVATDATGNAYVLQTGTNASLLALSGSTTQTVIAAGKGLVTPSAMTMDAAGDWFIADATHGSIARFGADGSVNTAYVAGLDTPTAVAVDGYNNLFVAQAGSTHTVIEIYATGARRVIAGNGSNSAADGVTAITAAFVSPAALTLDLNGKLYIADSGAHQVYAIDQNDIIHIVAGNSSTTLAMPTSLATDAAGDLYIADQTAAHIYVVYANGSMATVLDGSGANGVLATGPLSIALDASGNVFAANAATNSMVEINYSNPTLNFGTVNVGSSSAVLSQQLGNIGTDSLNITAPFSTTDTHFAVDASSTCGTTILPGSVCGLSFHFTPTAGVAYTAAAVVASNSYNTPQSIQLLGNGKQAATLTITLPAESQTYGQPYSASVGFNGTTAAPTGTVSFTTNGQTLCSISGNLGAVTTCHSISNTLTVGSYTVAFNYSGDSNYAAVSGTTTLVVQPAALTVTPVSLGRSYGAANPLLHGTVTGVAANDTILVAYSTTATATSGVGSYPIIATLTPVNGASLSNYTVTNHSGTLAVTVDRTLVVTVDSLSRVYGTTNPTFTSTITGLVNNDVLTISYTTTATATSSAGRYMINATVSGVAAANYAPAINQGALTITAAATTTAMATSTASATVGDTITFTAHVSAATSTVTNPVSGTVNFYDGTTLLGSGTLNSGVTTFQTNGLAAGTHSVSAAFQANTNFNTSGSAMVPELINEPVGSFTITPVQTSQYIRGAGTTTYQINLQATGAFTGKVALTCSGLPADSTCSFSNAAPMLTAGGTATTTLTVTNTVADAKLQQPAGLNPARFAPVTAAAVFPFELTGLGVFLSGLRRKSFIPNKKTVLIVLFLLIGMIGLTGCGVVTTQAKSYTVTVTGTPMSFPSAAQVTSVVLSVGQQVQ